MIAMFARSLTILSLIMATPVLAQTEVTIDELNKARDAYVQAERDKVVSAAQPDRLHVTLGDEAAFDINSDESGFAEILAAVKAAAAARAASVKEALPIIVKEPTKEPSK